jgi:UDP-N-acetylglucosamine 4,6-dehydratase
MKIVDLVEAVAPGAETYEMGIRPGEKLHEEMISEDDSRRTVRIGDRYVVLPTVAEWSGWRAPEGGIPVPDGFSYRSDTNDLWLSSADITRMLEDMD